jgi:hypothetical protein
VLPDEEAGIVFFANIVIAGALSFHHKAEPTPEPTARDCGIL